VLEVFIRAAKILLWPDQGHLELKKHAGGLGIFPTLPPALHQKIGLYFFDLFDKRCFEPRPMYLDPVLIVDKTTTAKAIHKEADA
jgi:hypothetical protein